MLVKRQVKLYVFMFYIAPLEQKCLYIKLLLCTLNVYYFHTSFLDRIIDNKKKKTNFFNKLRCRHTYVNNIET